MNKKGSHVGMMISVVVFVTFLAFLYSVISPTIKTGQDKELILNSLIINLVEMLDSNYTSGSIKTNNVNFMAEINALSNTYDNNYEALKTNLEVGEGDEFGFSFISEQGVEITTERTPPTSVNVYAKKIPIYYTGGAGNVLLGFITLKIW